MKKTKGQVGETLTWVVATLLVVFLMVFFIFGASLLGGTKKIGDFRQSLTQKTTFEGGDPFLQKSLFTYDLLSSDTEKIIIDKALTKLADEGKFHSDYNKTKKEILLRSEGR